MENKDISMISEGFQEVAGRDGGRCFGCGSANPHGLRLRFFADSASLFSPVEVPVHLCGWSSLVHGGIIATMLDEIMGWAAIHFLKRLPLTKSMRVEYHAPVPVQTPLRLTGWVEDHRSARLAVMKASLHDGEGCLCAGAEGEISLFTLDAARKKGFADSEIIEDLRPFLDNG